jgi:hypothetical protein
MSQTNTIGGGSGIAPDTAATQRECFYAQSFYAQSFYAQSFYAQSF